MAFLALKAFTLDTHPRSTKDGQCDSYCLCEQDGGNPLIILVKPGSRGMEMVYRKVSQDSCGTPAREGKCAGRLAISSLQRLERLETGRGSVRKAGRSDGTFFYRPVCVQNKQATPSLLQLEAGPISMCSGCIVNSIDQPLPIPLPSFHNDQQMPREDHERRSRCGDDSTDLAEPSLVSRTTEGSNKRTHSPPNVSGHHTEHIGRVSPTSDRGPSPISRLAHIRQSFTSRGFSEGVIGILKPSQHTPQFGGNEIAGVLQGAYVQFQHL